jgi:hypothetical protein
MACICQLFAKPSDPVRLFLSVHFALSLRFGFVW